MGLPPSVPSRLCIPFCFVAILLAGIPVAAHGQGGFQWPDRAENLQSLPADFPGDRLRAVMTGFTRALGVRCSHCHVGEEGQPLSEYDMWCTTCRASRARPQTLEEPDGSF